MNRFLNYLRSFFPSKLDPALVDVRNSDGSVTNIESSGVKVCFEMSIEQAKTFRDFLEERKWDIQRYGHQVLVDKVSKSLDKTLDSFWFNISSAPDSENYKFEILYNNGSSCLGKCVKITQDDGKRKSYYIPVSASFNESLELIKTGIQPTHWRKV